MHFEGPRGITSTLICSDVVPPNKHVLIGMPGGDSRYAERIVRTAPDSVANTVLIWDRDEEGNDNLFCTNYHPSEEQTNAEVLKQFTPDKAHSRTVILVQHEGQNTLTNVIK